MNFYQAYDLAKKGARVKRKSWGEYRNVQQLDSAPIRPIDIFSEDWQEEPKEQVKTLLSFYRTPGGRVLVYLDDRKPADNMYELFHQEFVQPRIINPDHANQSEQTHSE